MQTIAEMPEFIRRSEKVLGSFGRQALIEYLAEFPKAGVLMQGTGGIRKLRRAREGSGKSGGVRVIYYFHNEHMPLYLLTIFGKGERNELAKLVKVLVQRAEAGQ
jgi:hypothetical protein